jgi:hypothetical protein
MYRFRGVVMQCDFYDFGDTPNAKGERRLRCRTCGFTTAPTKTTPERFHAACRRGVGGGDVGTELTRLIKELGIKINCKQCKELAGKMRQWGIAGCRENRAEIVREISSRVGDVSWPTIIAAGMRAALTLPINPLDPVGSLLDEAVRRTEVAESLRQLSH